MVVFIAFVCTPLAFADGTLDSRYEEARRNYSLTLAADLLPEIQTQYAASPIVENGWLLAKAALLVSELRRIEYESFEGDPRDKRLLGRDIDAAAKIGLDALTKLPESSERYRIEANILGTMIRSRYKGKKYAGRMEEATNKAVELGPDNPDALVTAALRPLFASENHGGDISKALAYLDRALEIDPRHEKALVFYGIGQDKLGHSEEALKYWNRVLELNPASKLAREQLKNVETYDF